MFEDKEDKVVKWINIFFICLVFLGLFFQNEIMFIMAFSWYFIAIIVSLFFLNTRMKKDIAYFKNMSIPYQQIKFKDRKYLLEKNIKVYCSCYKKKQPKNLDELIEKILSINNVYVGTIIHMREREHQKFKEAELAFYNEYDATRYLRSKTGTSYKRSLLLEKTTHKREIFKILINTIWIENNDTHIEKPFIIKFKLIPA